MKFQLLHCSKERFNRVANSGDIVKHLSFLRRLLCVGPLNIAHARLTKNQKD